MLSSLLLGAMDTFEFFENFVQEDKKSTTNILGFIEFCPQSNLKNLCAVFKHFQQEWNVQS